MPYKRNALKRVKLQNKKVLKTTEELKALNLSSKTAVIHWYANQPSKQPRIQHYNHHSNKQHKNKWDIPVRINRTVPNLCLYVIACC